MIKQLRVTVDGRAYDVTVELPDELGAPSASDSPASPPAASRRAGSTPAATPVPAATPAATPLPAASATGAAVPGDVPCPLAGRVTAIVVKVGQDVKEGDHLLTLEAMKMNTFVFAPRTGKITEIKTAVGDAVEEGHALMRIQ